MKEKIKYYHSTESDRYEIDSDTSHIIFNTLIRQQTTDNTLHHEP